MKANISALGSYNVGPKGGHDGDREEWRPGI